MKKVSILFTGDFCPQLRMEELVLQKRYAEIFNDMLPEFEKSDLKIIDLECPLLTGETKIDKTGPHLKCIPASVEAIRFAGIDAVALANNHIRDYGSEGITETIKHCEAAGIKTVGAGNNLEEARQPLILTHNEIRVAIINITENEWSNSRGPEPGANPLDLPKNFADIRSAKTQADFVVVIFHGGNEFYELPSPRIKETLRFFVEAGASAVISHHTHIVSGFEVYQGAPIFYSLGNFCFDWPTHRSSFWNIGMAVRLHLGESVSFEIIPFRQNGDQAGVFKLSDKEKENVEQHLNQLNDIIADDTLLAKHFDDFCRGKEDIYNIYLEPYRQSWLASLRRRHWIPSLFGKQKKRLILNITRCESHRDVFMKYLEK